MWSSFDEVFSSMRKSWRDSHRRSRKPQRYRLDYERLEDRRVLSSVTTQAGLIAAINAANVAGGSNSITLGKNITLYEATADNTNDGPNGLPFITSGDNLTINGNGHTILRSTSAGSADFRFFDVASGGRLTLKILSLKNGLVSESTSGTLQGGAIFVEGEGKLNLNAAIVSGNSVNNEGISTNTESEGGAIYNSGTTNISASVITGNSAVFAINFAPGQGNGDGSNSTGGGNGNMVDNGAVGADVEGGGVYNTGSLTISSSSVLNNSAIFSVINGNLTPPSNVGNGNSNGDMVTDADNGNDDGNGILNSVFVEGGGIANSGNVTLSSDTLVGNRATSTVVNGSDNGNGNGDNASSENGTVDGNGVVDDLFVAGGGLYNVGSATLKTDSFVGNWASSSVTNGSNNGNNNGDNDSDDDNGDFNGNGVLGDVTVAGGGIFSDNMLSASYIGVVANYAASTVINGSCNGNGNGVMTESDNGNENGNGVDGQLAISGGGIENADNGTMSLSHSAVSANSISNTIVNGNNNGDGDGENNAGLGNMEGKNNGNAVGGPVIISGAGIDNAYLSSLTINSSVVSANAIKSSVTNGNMNGNSDGNNDGDGDALASDYTVHGGGIHSASTMTINSTVLSANSITSTVRNGNNDGNDNGDNNAENQDGRANGNAISGDVLIAGGAIANSDILTINKCVLTVNSLKSTIANGNNDGDNNGNDDGSFNDCGINCGNAVFGDVEVDGGAIGNSGTATVSSSTLAGNSISSTVTNGIGDGNLNGNNSTGTDGQGDGNGVDGNVVVVGGGTANLNAGTLTLVSTMVVGNSVHSSPTSGSGDTTFDGQIVNGTVTVSGANTF